MDILQQFEYPLPTLSLDIESIDAETYSVYEGSFNIRNTGGGKLTGQITSENQCIVFHERDFEAPARINYRISVEKFQIGDVIHTGAIILSNGGEKFLPIIVKVCAYSITAEDGTRISTLAAFADYARANPQAASQLMRGSEFRSFLKGVHYELTDVYERVLADPEHERGLECFLRISGLKSSTRVSTLLKHVEVAIAPLRRELYYGRIPIQKDGWGYISSQIDISENTPWLKVTNTVAAALEQSNMLEFCIDPSQLKTRVANGTIRLAGSPGAEATVTVIKKPLLAARLEREVYRPEETGSIMINNNTGKDLLLDIAPSEAFVQFQAKSYYIAEFAQVPFMIRTSSFQAMTARRQPLPVLIDIRAMLNDQMLYRRLKLIVGDYQ